MSDTTGEQIISSKDGTDIFIKQMNVASPKAQVLVLHGYLEYCLRYQEFAKHLNGKGISVTLFDYRGHGKSGGGRACLGDWTNYEEDLETAKSTLLPNIPTFILGHSTGGLITLNCLLDGKLTDLSGVILAAPYVRPTGRVPFYKKWAAKVFGYWIPSLPVPTAMESSHLTCDVAKQEEHKNDPMILNDATMGWAVRTMAVQDKVVNMASSSPISVPLLYAFGSDDMVADPKVLEEVGNQLQAADKTIVKREGERHEILNEVKREELYDIIGDWILKKA